MKWEYCVYSTSRSPDDLFIQALLTEYGRVGWELVSVVLLEGKLVHYLKRQKES